MHMKPLFLFLLFPFQVVLAQNEITLGECYRLARENYPARKNLEIQKEITGLKRENIRTGNFPRVNLSGQATYQSDVPGINQNVPGVSIAEVPKFQYKSYAEINQTLWDGGVSSAGRDLEDALLQSNLSQLEVEMYQLNEQVASAFFSALSAGKQQEVLAAQKKVLQEKLQGIQSAIQNQVLEKSAGLALKAEILHLEQKEAQLEAGKSASLRILSILTGKKILGDPLLTFREASLSTGRKTDLRPERKLFSNQQNRLEKQMTLLDKKRNPGVFGFGQAGIGKPGMNMLNDDFDDFYLVGVGLSWKIFDWKSTAREKQILQLQKQTINQQEKTFNQRIEMLLARQDEAIKKLKKQLQTDLKIIELKTEICKAAASKLQNGTITSSEYIRELQAETVAKLNHELHKIELNQAREMYRIIRGKQLPAGGNATMDKR